MRLKRLFETARKLEEASSSPAVLSLSVGPYNKAPHATAFPDYGIGMRTSPMWHYFQAYLEGHWKFKLVATKKKLPALVLGETLAVDDVGAADPVIQYLGTEHGLSPEEAHEVSQKVKDVKLASSKILKGTLNLKKVALTFQQKVQQEAKDLLEKLGPPFSKYDLFVWGDVDWHTFIVGPSTPQIARAAFTKLGGKLPDKIWIRDVSGETADIG